MAEDTKIRDTKINSLYRTIKCPLKSVLKNYTVVQPIIERNVIETNQFVIYGYQFIKLYLLDKFQKGEKFPTIDEPFILDVLRTIGESKQSKKIGKVSESKDSSVPSTVKEAKKIVDIKRKKEIKTFYDQEFSKVIKIQLVPTNKSYILAEIASQMVTCIETNIATHFIKHLFKYINCKFRDPQKLVIKEIKNKAKRDELSRQLNAEIRNLKSDLINNKTEKSDPKYHEFLSTERHLLYPTEIDKSVAYDVKAHRDRYLHHSFYINQQIEKLGRRPYEVIPQRNNIVPKSIVLNTSAIVDIFDPDEVKQIFGYGKKEMKTHIKQYQQHIWGQLFKLEKNSIFKDEKYAFFHQITTDGFSCSILCILKAYKDEPRKYKTPKQVESLMDTNECDTFKKIESLDEKQCAKYLTDQYKLIGNDPGAKKILAMIDEDGHTFKYTSYRRRFDNYTKRSNEIIKKEKKRHNIIAAETALSKYSSRTLDINKYKDFIAHKKKLNDQVNDFYQRTLFRKLAFRRFARTKQSEDNLIHEIRNKFLTKKEQKDGKKLVLLYGDYSRTSQMRGCIPAPNIGIKKLLAKNFETFEIHEHLTSQLHHGSFKRMTNLKVRRGKHNRPLHAILTRQEDSKRIVVNRDVNASKNILYLGKYYLQHQDRPEEFRHQLKQIKPKIKITLKPEVKERLSQQSKPKLNASLKPNYKEFLMQVQLGV